jgi:hypothetical protein
MPLYERADGQRRREIAEGVTGMCAVHNQSEAIGTCQRCLAPFCASCRTRWHDKAVCVSCLERALAVQETTPEEDAAHRRQAQFSMWCAVGAWALLLVGTLPLLALRAGGANEQLKVVSKIVLLSSLIPALFAIGQGAGAIRVRGERLKHATWGLSLAGSLVGLTIGFLTFNMWFN